MDGGAGSGPVADPLWFEGPPWIRHMNLMPETEYALHAVLGAM